MEVLHRGLETKNGIFERSRGGRKAGEGLLQLQDGYPKNGHRAKFPASKRNGEEKFAANKKLVVNISICGTFAI